MVAASTAGAQSSDGAAPRESKRQTAQVYKAWRREAPIDGIAGDLLAPESVTIRSASGRPLRSPETSTKVAVAQSTPWAGVEPATYGEPVRFTGKLTRTTVDHATGLHLSSATYKVKWIPRRDLNPSPPRWKCDALDTLGGKYHHPRRHLVVWATAATGATAVAREARSIDLEHNGPTPFQCPRGPRDTALAAEQHLSA